MAKNSAIEWCHHTVNFWWGCVFATLLDGSLDECCRNCYAHMLSKLFSRGKATWGPKGNRWIRHEAARRELYKLDKDAWKRGVRERVFINSMSDTFEDRDDLNEAREMLWDACQFVTNLDILILTKRPQNVRRMVRASWLQSWPAHVWIGTTIGTQQAADERIAELLCVPARVRFLSCEPLLGPVNLFAAKGDPRNSGFALTDGFGRVDGEGLGIHWVICGGESGPKARPMHPDWARKLRDQCADAGAAFFFKQWGEWYPVTRFDEETVGVSIVRAKGSEATHSPKNPQFFSFDDGQQVARVGKSAAGRHLDGVEHSNFPEVRA